ncbi:MAG TPA: hypothetical protein VFT31_01950 [Kribbella sp.]|nr:hypothetical protein [Kribbella sp.]
MAVEDELLEEMVRVFQRLRRMVERFRSSSGLSRRQQRRVLREAMRDWLRDDPEANSLRQRMDDREFERRVAAEVERVLTEREQAQSGPNDLDRDRADTTERRDEAEQTREDRADRDGNGIDDGDERQDQAQQDLDDRDGDGVTDAAEEHEEDRAEQERAEDREREEADEQVEENPDHVRLDLVPVAAGVAAAEADELTDQLEDGPEQNPDHVRLDLQPVATEAEVQEPAAQQVEEPAQQVEQPEETAQQVEGQVEQIEPAEETAQQVEETAQQVEQVRDEQDPREQVEDQQRSGALEDEPDPEVLQTDATEQPALPTAGDRRAEAQAEQTGEQAEQTGEQTEQTGEQSHERPGVQGPQDGLSDELQRLHAVQAGHAPAAGAAQRPSGVPEVTPVGAHTAGARAQKERATHGASRGQDSGGHERGRGDQ